MQDKTDHYIHKTVGTTYVACCLSNTQDTGRELNKNIKNKVETRRDPMICKS